MSILGREFNNLTDRLQISENKRRQFVSDASHELKTPLASIKLLSDSILQYDMDMETVKEFVGDIGNEADRLTRMTTKLLALTKGEVSDDEVDAEIILMAPTIERVAKMLSGTAKENNITIETDLEQDSHVLIQEDDLYQIAFNLAENGIKYNVPGGTLHISLHRQEDNAILRVKDTGMGISEELGGIPNLTVGAIVMTGLCGNMIAAGVVKLFRIEEPLAAGLAIGSASHALGTAKALEMGELQGAMSSLAISVCGLLTVFGASVFALFY